MLVTKGVQIVQVTDGDSADGLTDQLGLDIESGNQAESIVVVGDETADGSAQAAASKEDGGQPLTVPKQETFQDGQQIVHRIPYALAAVDIADAVEILPDLGCGGAHLSGQFPGGDAGNVRILQGSEIAVVFG